MGDTINPSIYKCYIQLPELLNMFSIVKILSIHFLKNDEVIFNLFYFLYIVFSISLLIVGCLWHKINSCAFVCICICVVVRLIDPNIHIYIYIF